MNIKDEIRSIMSQQYYYCSEETKNENIDKIHALYKKALEDAEITVKCPECNGSGLQLGLGKPKVHKDGSKSYIQNITCPNCKGTGEIPTTFDEIVGE